MAMIERLEAMLASGRDDTLLRFGLGSAFFKAGEHEKAIPHLKAAVVHDPGYSAAWKLLGKALWQTGDPVGARDAFDQGRPIADAAGDKQTVREIDVFLRKLDRAGGDTTQGDDT